MTTCRIDWYDEKGNVLDIAYIDSITCMYEMFAGEDLWPDDIAGTITYPEGSVDYGPWPGGDETDHDVHCATCGQLMWRGRSNETV